VVDQLAARFKTTLHERRVGLTDRLEFSSRGRTVERRDDGWDEVGVAANGVALPDAARVEADHVVGAPPVGEMVPGGVVAAEERVDADARPTRDEEQGARALRGIDRELAGEP
jgi:hypothetical protein